MRPLKCPEGRMNAKLALGLLIFATAAWAQENSATLSHAGCGPDPAKFDVKRKAPSSDQDSGTRQGVGVCVWRFGTGQCFDSPWGFHHTCWRGWRMGRSLRTQVLHVLFGRSW